LPSCVKGLNLSPGAPTGGRRSARGTTIKTIKCLTGYNCAYLGVLTDLRTMLEPYAAKVARTVLRRGKRVISYLFQPPDSANTSVDV